MPSPVKLRTQLLCRKAGSPAVRAERSDGEARARFRFDQGRTAGRRPFLQRPSQVVRETLLLALATMLAIVPPLLVVWDRWLEEPLDSPWIREWWCRIEAVCRLHLPPYFLLAFVSLAGATISVWLIRSTPVLSSSGSVGKVTAFPEARVRPGQRQLSRWLLLVSAAGAAVVVARTLVERRLPGWDLVLCLLVYTCGWVLREVPLQCVAVTVRRRRHVIAAGLVLHLALIVFLAETYSSRKPAWLPGLLVALTTSYLFSRHRRQVPYVFWIVSLAMVLHTLHVDAWWFSVAGDEYAFYAYARAIVEDQGISVVGSRLFQGVHVYGSHPYLSSLIQAGSMQLLGTGNFGWRFSGIYLSAVSIGFFYSFFRAFVPRRIALLACVFLATSEYLMGFAKIGYNNLQALFAMSLVLSAGAWSVRARRHLGAVVLGLSMGFCFYVYPAALYVLPLAVLLLLVYDPPRSRHAAERWGLTLVSMLLWLFPLLVQPDYWATRKAGSLLSNPDLMGSAKTLSAHVLTNTLYSLTSFLYAVEESHFVAVSYLDPLSGVLTIIGMACVLRRLRRVPFAQFLAVGYAWLLLGLGATQEGPWPHTTRMFLLLPFLALFAATGLIWIEANTKRLHGQWLRTDVLVPLILVMVTASNLYQAYPLSRYRLERHQYLEPLFVKVAMRAQELEEERTETFVFITDPAWSVEGIRLNQQRVYGVPASPAQLVQVTVTAPQVPESAYDIISDRDSLVIIKPWLEPEWREALGESLRQLGKIPCDVKTVKGTVRFQVWHSGAWAFLCE